MSKLEELKINIISDTQFNAWKARWDGTLPIPKEIERYFWEVQMKTAEDAFKEWSALIPGKV